MESLCKTRPTHTAMIWAILKDWQIPLTASPIEGFFSFFADTISEFVFSVKTDNSFHVWCDIAAIRVLHRLFRIELKASAATLFIQHTYTTQSWSTFSLKWGNFLLWEVISVESETSCTQCMNLLALVTQDPMKTDKTQANSSSSKTSWQHMQPAARCLKAYQYYSCLCLVYLHRLSNFNLSLWRKHIYCTV